MQKNGLAYIWLLLCAAVVAIVCLSIVGRWHPFVPLDKELAMLDQPTQEQIGIIRSHNQFNDSYVFAVFGALATAAGTPVILRGLSNELSLSNVLKPIAFLACILVGAGVGFASAHIGFYCQDWLPMWDPLVRSAVLRSAMFAPLGLIGGILTVLFHQKWGQSLNLVAGGLIGAIGAATLYCLVAGFLFQGENSDAVLPVGPYSRILLFAATPFLIWAVIAMQFFSAVGPVLEPSARQVETA